jgi:hypothetical protein
MTPSAVDPVKVSPCALFPMDGVRSRSDPTSANSVNVQPPGCGDLTYCNPMADQWRRLADVQVPYVLLKDPVTARETIMLTHML